jgi:hypothetical protein
MFLGMLSHAPTSGLESGMAGMPHFYKEDELKYHGKVNRGIRQVNLQQVRGTFNTYSIVVNVLLLHTSVF